MMNFLKVFYLKQMAIWSLIFNQRAIAIGYWEKIRTIRPNDPMIPASIAHLKAELGQKREAIALLHQSLAMKETNALAWYNIGFIHQEFEEQVQAIEAFDKAIFHDEKMDLAFYGKALALIKLGKVEEAIPLLKRNTELQPMSPYGWYQLAHAYCKLGQPEKARKTILKLSSFEPKVAIQVQNETGIDAGVVSPFAGYSK
jgi:tetratricopeptide (TPR) repeat protein